MECAVVALYFIRSIHARLGMIAVFTACFAAAMGILSNARRAEIFAATAAYAAVLVVFLAQDISSGRKQEDQ
jgi:hypothetical protein